MSAEAIEELMQEFVQRFEKQDVEGILELYTDDARLLPPDAPAVEGKAAMKALLQGFVDVGITTGTFDTVDLDVVGDTAIRQGAFELRGTSPNGRELTNAGKSLEIYKKQSDGSWKLAVEMFNADEPAQG